jgi:predicted ATPase
VRGKRYSLIDWSWNLLDEPERILLRRLSVFSGGLTLEAAQAVAGFDGLDTFEGLEQLANKSLVVVDRLEGAQVRYHLLESIRQYARDRLFEAGEGEALRHHHAAYFAVLILEAYHQVMGRDMLVWLKLVRQELDNMRWPWNGP